MFLQIEKSAVHQIGKIMFVDLGNKLTVLRKILDNLHRTLYPVCQSAGTLSLRLHDTQNGRILIVKMFRRTA